MTQGTLLPLVGNSSSVGDWASIPRAGPHSSLPHGINECQREGGKEALGRWLHVKHDRHWLCSTMGISWKCSPGPTEGCTEHGINVPLIKHQGHCGCASHGHWLGTGEPPKSRQGGSDPASCKSGTGRASSHADKSPGATKSNSRLLLDVLQYNKWS